MKSWLMSTTLAVSSLLCVTVAPSHSAAPEARHFIVDVVAINGEEFVVKDESGAEGKIQVGTDTEKYGHFQPGDRIEAWVYPNGHAKTVVIIRSASVIQEDQMEQNQHQAQR
jgi:hypothetical protein